MLLALVGATPALAQNPEAGVTILGQSERVLRIDSYRPLDSAAYILASDYQINISAEDPPFAFSDDILDSHPSRQNPLAEDHAYSPKRSSFEVRFSVNSARYPTNNRELLDQVVAVYNRKSNFQYRLQQEGDFFSFVPISARDRTCRVIGIDALLDQKISLPNDKMGIYRAVAAIESAMSRNAREPVYVNTQDWINRIPDLKVSFPSTSEPARDILLTVIKATHYRFYWLARERPLRGGWTINVIPLTGRTVREPGGGFRDPGILWPGQLPLPPMPPPRASNR